MGLRTLTIDCCLPDLIYVEAFDISLEIFDFLPLTCWT